MRYEQVTVRHGESLGPVDWSYDFTPHFDSFCLPEKKKAELCAKRVAMYREIEAAWKDGKTVRVYMYSDYGKEVIEVAMYDGQPYWKPVPSVCYRSPLGGCEWSSLCSVNYFSVDKDSSSGKEV